MKKTEWALRIFLSLAGDGLSLKSQTLSSKPPLVPPPLALQSHLTDAREPSFRVIMSSTEHEEKPIGTEGKVDHRDDSELSSVGDDSLELTPAEERRLRRKIDWRILPYCSLLYLLSA